MKRALAVLLLLAAPAAAQVVYLPGGGGGGFSGGAITAPLLVTPGGSSGAPAYSFLADTDLGFYRVTTGRAGFAAGGNLIFDFNTARISTTVGIQVPNGSATAVTYGFNTDGDDTGFWLNGSANLVASSANVAQWQLNTAALRMRSAIQLNWSSGDPSVSGADVGFARNGIGVAGVTNGSTGAGALDVGNLGFFKIIGSAGNTAGISQPNGADNSGITIVPGNVASRILGVYRRGSDITLELAGGSGNVIQLDGANSSIKFGTPSTGSTLDVGIVRAGGGVLRVSDAGSGVGSFRFTHSVAVNTTTLASGTTQSEMMTTNTGDTDGSSFTLPNDPTIGTCFDFAVTAAFAFDVTPSAGETVRDGATSGTTKITSNTVGSALRLCAVTGGSGAIWMTMFKIGTWTVS